jgi:hypothetical protein
MRIVGDFKFPRQSCPAMSPAHHCGLVLLLAVIAFVAADIFQGCVGWGTWKN